MMVEVGVQVEEIAQPAEQLREVAGIQP